MSYILKALRKSEKERQRAREPTLAGHLQVQGADTSESTSTGRLTFWLIVLLILNAGVLGYFVVSSLDSRPEDASKQVGTQAVQPAIKPPAEPVRSGQTASGDGKNSAPSQPSPTNQPRSIDDLSRRFKNAAVQVAETGKRGDDVGTSAREVAEAAAPILSPEVKPEPAETLPATKQEPDQHALPWLEELPVDFRRSVPSLKINMHVYSKIPENRFVLVSMQKFFINQEISADMVLKDIQADGIVVSYHGRTFKIRR